MRASEIGAILEKVKREKNLDFTEYRESTIRRRIERRLLFSSAGSLKEYAALIEKDPHELDRLVHDLTIHVTEPFRDPEAWDVLRKVLAGREEMKIWSAGCARGDEAHSLAELCGELNIQAAITGTDLEEDCIKQAAARPGCEFRVHDLVKDAPFDKFDLIVCRNVLIYFSKTLQEKVLNKFYNSLKPGGLLWLGNSETLRGESAQSFEMVDSKARIYRRNRE